MFFSVFAKLQVTQEGSPHPCSWGWRLSLFTLLKETARLNAATECSLIDTKTAKFYMLGTLVFRRKSQRWDWCSCVLSNCKEKGPHAPELCSKGLSCKGQTRHLELDMKLSETTLIPSFFPNFMVNPKANSSTGANFKFHCVQPGWLFRHLLVKSIDQCEPRLITFFIRFTGSMVCVSCILLRSIVYSQNVQFTAKCFNSKLKNW